MKRIVSFLLIILFGFISIIQADISEDLEQFGKENGQKYLQPFVTAFGSDLNSGWFHKAKIRPFNIGFTINGMLAVVPSDEKSFMIHNPNPDYYEGDYQKTATVFGGNGAEFESTVPGVENLRLPNGFNIGMVPLLVPQAHLGLPAGFEVAFRLIPKYDIKDYGELFFWGVGAKYQVSKLIPMLTTLLPISVQASYQQLEVSDIIKVKSTFFNVHASRGLVAFPITLYGGIGYEDTKLEAKYTYTEPWPDGEIKSIDFNISGENSLRFTAGVSLKILLLDVMLDYSVGKYQTVRLGVGFSI